LLILKIDHLIAQGVKKLIRWKLRKNDIIEIGLNKMLFVQYIDEVNNNYKM